MEEDDAAVCFWVCGKEEEEEEQEEPTHLFRIHAKTLYIRKGGWGWVETYEVQGRGIEGKALGFMHLHGK